MITIEDLSVGDAVTLGPTGATREQVMAFARAWDPQTFHLSDEAAAETYFGRLSASGWHTAAMTLALIGDNPHWPLVCRGCRKIFDLRWRRPVYPDDALHVAVTVDSVEFIEGQTSGTATLALCVTNQDDATVAELGVVLVVASRCAEN